MGVSRVRRRGQVTLPSYVRRKAETRSGDVVHAEPHWSRAAASLFLWDRPRVENPDTADAADGENRPYDGTEMAAESLSTLLGVLLT